jgi:hypothetical protein
MTDRSVVVATTLATYVTNDPDTSLAWLYDAERLRDEASVPVQFFAAIETDSRGLAPFTPLTDRLTELGGTWWTFSFDDGATEVRTDNRLRRITLGQNMASTFTLDNGGSHMLFMAADCQPPPDTIDKLLELDWPIVGGEVTTYGLHGPTLERHPRTGAFLDYPVELHMATAAFVMLDREILRKVHWRYDTDAGMSDDPALHHDAMNLGYATLVRKDVIGRHYPTAIGPIETRFPGRDMRIQRSVLL